MKILHFPTLIGANPPSLAAAERRLGHESLCVSDVPSPFDFDSDRVLLPNGGSLVRRAIARVKEANALRVGGGFDVVHFNGGQTALNRWGFAIDVPAWRRAGVRICTTFQGSDARPSAALLPGPPRARQRFDDLLKSWHVRRLARLSDHSFVLNPDLLPHVPGAEFVPYASVDHRVDGVTRGSGGDRLRVVHAPSVRWIKGTEFVLSARDEMGDQDYDWRLLEGLSRTEVCQELEQADVAIDQFRSGWYGGFSLEAMVRGVPTICYIDPAQLRLVPKMFRDALPLVSCTGEALADTIAELRRDRGRREELGARCRAFASRFHDPRRIAGAMIAVYRGSHSAFWQAWNNTEDPPPMNPGEPGISRT